MVTPILRVNLIGSFLVTNIRAIPFQTSNPKVRVRKTFAFSNSPSWPSQWAYVTMYSFIYLPMSNNRFWLQLCALCAWFSQIYAVSHLNQNHEPILTSVNFRRGDDLAYWCTAHLLVWLVWLPHSNVVVEVQNHWCLQLWKTDAHYNGEWPIVLHCNTHAIPQVTNWPAKKQPTNLLYVRTC